MALSPQASSNMMKERINENHPWITDDVKYSALTKGIKKGVSYDPSYFEGFPKTHMMIHQGTREREIFLL